MIRSLFNIPTGKSKNEPTAVQPDAVTESSIGASLDAPGPQGEKHPNLIYDEASQAREDVPDELAQNGVNRVEAISSVWSKKMLVFAYIVSVSSTQS